MAYKVVPDEIDEIKVCTVYPCISVVGFFLYWGVIPSVTSAGDSGGLVR